MRNIFLYLLLLCSSWARFSLAQIVLYSEDFSSGGTGWNLSGNGSVLIPGSSPSSNGSSSGFWVVNNVGATIDGTNNLHPTCGDFFCNFLGTPGPLYNAGGANTFTNIVAHMSTDVSAATLAGVGPYTLEFDWICNGGVLDPGDGAARLIYSVNGGLSWSELPFDYIGETTVQQQVIAINPTNFPGFIPGTSTFRIGFRWFYFSSGGGVPSDPPMIVDNIEVKGPASSNSITTNAPVPAPPYCAGAAIIVSFTSTGTFAAGNSYTAQLSDATGSFASPTNIGTLSSTANSGNISAGIPGGTPAGTGYLIRVVSSNPLATGSSFGPFTVNPAVTPSVSISANPGNTICAGSPVTFTASPVNGGSPSYQWQVNGSNIGGATAATFSSSTLSNGDVVTVVMTSTAACATPATVTSNSITMTVNPVLTPSVSISANPGNTICAGSPVTFTASPVNGGSPSYQWQVNGSNIGGATAATFSSSTFSNGDVVTVVMTSTAACATPATVTSNSITMTVNPVLTPSVSISANPGNTICAGSPVTFTASPVNGGSPSYQWQVNGSNIGGATAATFSSSTLSNGDVVTVLMTSTAACATPVSAGSLPITISIVNNIVPSVTVSANPGATVCTGSLVTFTATPVNGGSSPSFQWQVNGTAVTGANSSTFSSSALNDGDQVVVTITSNDPCALPSTVSSVPFVLTVVNVILPAVSVNLAQSLPSCPGDMLDFTANPVNGGLNPTFQWQINGVDVTGATGVSFSSSALVNGDVVSVVLTSSDPCANPATTSSNGFNVLIGNLIATVSISVSSDTICAGAMPTFTATPLTGGGPSPAFVWTINGANAGNSSVFTPTSLNDGDMVVATMTPSDPCYALPVNSNPIIITVLPQVVPAITLIASADTICQGEPVIFSTIISGAGVNPGFQWLLNGNPIPGQSGDTLLSPGGVVLSNNDVVSVSMTSSDVCANPVTVSSNSINITISGTLQVPSISISAVSQTLCAGDSAIFNAIIANGGTSPQIQWQINGSNVSGATSSLFNSTNLSDGDVITATLVSNAACTSSTPVTSNAISMTINPQLTPVVSVNANPSSICQGQSVTFSISSSGGGTAPAFQWLLNGNTLPGQTGNTYTNSSISASDQVSVQMLSNDLCLTINPVSSLPVSVTVLPTLQPEVSISISDSTLCGNELPVFSGSFLNGGANPLFNWYVDGNLVLSSSAPNYSPTIFSSGQSVNCEMVSDYLCASPSTVSSRSIQVIITPQPEVNAGADVRVLLGNSVQLNATAASGLDYSWSPASGLSCSTCNNPVARPVASTTYFVEVINPLTDCRAVDSVFVEIFEQSDIFIPSAFSPNKDGFNDILFVRGNAIADLEFVVYNRFGQAVFTGASLSDGWDGTLKGQDLDSGVFSFTLKGKFNDGQEFFRSGNISLQR
jgi:gliding motility-associated-like protein